MVQFNEVILKACDEDRKQRYQCANEMRLDLQRLKAGKPIIRGKRAPRWKILAGVVLFTFFLAVGLMIRINRFQSMRTPHAPVQNSQSNTSNSIHGSDSNLQATVNSNELSGLVSWWKADGNALDSAGKNNGTLLEGAGFDIGKEGQAFLFNGAAACVSVPYSPAWAFGKKSFSISLWAKFSSVSDDQAFLAYDKGIANQHQKRWIFCLHEGLLQWHMDGGIGSIWLGSAKFNPVIGNWYHLAAMRDGDKFCFYINGVEVSSEILKGEVPDASSPLTIGNTWGGEAFNGLLDDIRIYNRALSSAELKTLAQSSQESANDVIVIGPRKYQRSEFMINTSFPDANSQANLAVLANGNFLATWHQGLFWHCYGQIFDPQGKPMGTPFLLNVDAPGDLQWGPSPAPLPDGGFIAAWGEQSKQRDTYAANGRCFDPAGIPVRSKFNLSLPDWTAVASYTNGDFIAVGTYAVGPKTDSDLPIYARRFNGAGTPNGASFQVGAVTNGYATASATYGSDGRFAFAWPSHTSNAMVRAYRSNEFSPFGPEFPANSISTSKGMINARYNSNHELIVIWSGSAGAVSNELFVRRFDSNMVAEASEWQVNETAPANHWSVSLSIAANDESLIVWESSQSNLFARLLDRNGNAIGHEFRVNQFTKGPRLLGWEACLHTAILRNGNFVVGWAGNGANGNGIYLTLFKLLDDKPASLKKP